MWQQHEGGFRPSLWLWHDERNHLFSSRGGLGSTFEGQPFSEQILFRQFSFGKALVFSIACQ